MTRRLASSLLFAALLASPRAFGQTQINYQGRLLKADGTPQAGVVNIDFALCDAVTAGACVAKQTLAVALSDGFYSVMLSATPADLVGPRFLSVTIGGVELTPRQPLGSVPLAVVATSVKGGTVDASQVTVGTTTISSTGVTVNGQPAMTSAATSAPLAGSGTTANPIRVAACTVNGQILKWNGTAWACAADASGTVTAVTATAPVVSTGGATPVISMPKATSLVDGYLAVADWITFNNKLATVSHDTSLAGAGTAGSLLSVAYGTTAGTAVQGNDARLANTNYIQNQTAAAQAAAFNINGGGTLGGALTVASSQINGGQGGSIELGAAGATANPIAGGTPFIDFHYGTGTVQDYNVRIINDVDGRLSFWAPNVQAVGNLSATGTLASAGNGTINGVGIGVVMTGYAGDTVNLAARFPGAAGDFYVQSASAAATWARFGAGIGGGAIYGNLAVTGNVTAANLNSTAASNVGGNLSVTGSSAFTGDVSGVPRGRNLINWTSTASKWALLMGTAPTIALNIADVLEGDSSFDVTSTVAGGTGGGWMAYGDFIPVDPNRRYEGRISAKLVSGAGNFFAGYAAYDATKAPLNGNGGLNGYFLAQNQVLITTGWTHFRNQITGEGAAINQFPVGTRFIKPIVISNFQNVGATRIDAFEMYEVGPEHLLGGRTLLAADTIYQAAADGFVIVDASAGIGYYDVLVGPASPPATRLLSGESYPAYGSKGPSTSPVRKGEFWKVATTYGSAPAQVWWMPLDL